MIIDERCWIKEEEEEVAMVAAIDEEGDDDEEEEDGNGTLLHTRRTCSDKFERRGDGGVRLFGVDDGHVLVLPLRALRRLPRALQACLRLRAGLHLHPAPHDDHAHDDAHDDGDEGGDDGDDHQQHPPPRPLPPSLSLSCLVR
eukprot:2550584-Rhodomonas_salina.1